MPLCKFASRTSLVPLQSRDAAYMQLRNLYCLLHGAQLSLHNRTYCPTAASRLMCLRSSPPLQLPRTPRRQHLLLPRASPSMVASSSSPAAQPSRPRPRQEAGYAQEDGTPPPRDALASASSCGSTAPPPNGSDRSWCSHHNSSCAGRSPGLSCTWTTQHLRGAASTWQTWPSGQTGWPSLRAGQHRSAGQSWNRCRSPGSSMLHACTTAEGSRGKCRQ